MGADILFGGALNWIVLALMFLFVIGYFLYRAYGGEGGEGGFFKSLFGGGGY